MQGGHLRIYVNGICVGTSTTKEPVNMLADGGRSGTVSSQKVNEAWAQALHGHCEATTSEENCGTSDVCRHRSIRKQF